MRAKVKNWIAISLLPQIILVKLLALRPDWIERYYSEGLYPIIAKSLRFLLGWIPFSMGDVIYFALGVLAIRYLYKNWKAIRRKPLLFLRDIVMVLGIVYFLFHFLWGMNYYRFPINEKLGITATYDKEELIAFTERLVIQANKSQYELTRDSTKAVTLTMTVEEIFSECSGGFQKIESIYSGFNYKVPSIKKSLFSLPLTYMGYGGYLNPFTNEAQVNAKIPAFRLPTISSHEIGHQLGYSAEDATNFIGFLAAKANPDPYFRFGANAHALTYCLSDIYRRDKDEFDRIYKKLHPGIQKNYQQLREFWDRYENPTEPIFKSIFNAFLKANSQQKGIQSYNYVVGLLIGYDKKYGF